MAAAGGTAEHGTPLPLCAVVVLLAGAARRLLGVAMAFLWELPNRESHSPRTRGAPLRRGCLIPYGNHSARSVALPAELTSHSPKTRRSAVKARLIDPLRESFGEERCAPRGDGVMAFKEAITWLGALDHATGCRVDAETVPMRAYVTSGLVPTRAKRHACALRPHATSCGRARWLAAHSRREGLAQHAPPVGGDLGLGLG
jgi:hypothetical protein